MLKAKKWASAKQRIERTPKIAELEMGWYRKKGSRRLVSAGGIRKRYGIDWLLPPHLQHRTQIHTHPILLKKQKGCFQSFPSRTDLHNFLEHIKKTNIRFSHIASIDRKGKVMGYFSLYASNRLVENLKQNTGAIKIISNEIKSHEPSHSIKSEGVKHWLELLSELGLKFSIKPMPSYRFNGREFVKKN